MRVSALPAVLALIFFSFSTIEKQNVSKKEVTYLANHFATSTLNNNYYTVDSVPFDAPLLRKDYLGFKSAVGYTESRNDYSQVNTLGYLGKYQFSKYTLAFFGIHNPGEFLKTPSLQEAAFYAYTAHNKWVLRKYISQYTGKVIGGIEVTESGILAAAHLAGAGGVKRFLRSGGARGASDAYGTTIKHYMKRFAGYDLSIVEANPYTKIDVPKLIAKA